MAALTITVAIGLPYVVIYCLTNFDPGQSTTEQRWWIMTSLVMGHFSLTLCLVVETLLRDRCYRRRDNIDANAEGTLEGHNYWRGIPRLVPIPGMLPPYVITLYLFSMSVPAIGAFVTVARMMLDYEVCTTI